VQINFGRMLKWSAGRVHISYAPCSSMKRYHSKSNVCNILVLEKVSSL